MIKGFVAGLVLANAFEWVAHKYVLHGTHRPGKPRYSPSPNNMKSHWEHHREVRKQNYYDDGYVQGLSNWRTKNEVVSLAVVVGVLFPVFWPINKGLAISTVYSACNYFYVHRRSHVEPAWGEKKIPWHFDHHMNSNQDANWGVTKPWFDYIMGTRVVSSPELKEQNPLGIPLPEPVSKLLTKTVEHFFPVKTVETEKNELKTIVPQISELADEQAEKEITS